MSTQPTITTIIFDMDGLILDTERMALQAWNKATAEWGFHIPSEIFLDSVGRTVSDTKTIFSPHFKGIPFEVVHERKQYHLSRAIEEDGIPLKPGLLDLLNWLDQTALLRGVATSTQRPLALKKLAVSGLRDRFSVIVCGNEVKKGKPAPDIFLAAAERLAVNPEHCLVLEDSNAGIKAARRAGMTPVMIPDMKLPSPETELLAFAILESLPQVRPLLEQCAPNRI